VPYRAARDRKAAKYFNREAGSGPGARSAIGHWLVQNMTNNNLKIINLQVKSKTLLPCARPQCGVREASKRLAS
jgi:hypothetical protein